jgi:hypothetical protein
MKGAGRLAAEFRHGHSSDEPNIWLSDPNDYPGGLAYRHEPSSSIVDVRLP